MKELAQLREELNEIRKQAGNIFSQLDDIDKDISDILYSKNTDEEINLDIIKKLSDQSRFKIKNHYLCTEKKQDICERYISALIGIAFLGTDCINDKLIYINMLLNISKFADKISFEDMLKKAYINKPELYYDIMKTFPTECKGHFVIDMLITANMGGNISEEVLRELSAILSASGLSMQDMAAFSAGAKAVLTKNINKTPKKYIKRIPMCYIDYILENTEEKIILNMPSKTKSTWIWKVKSGHIVYKSDIIAKDGIHTYRASASGYIYVYTSNKLHYAVISHKGENIKDIKQRLRMKNKT